LELSLLLKPLNIPFNGSLEIKGITENSKKVRPGYLFFAYRGLSLDGNSFVKEALRNGASAVFTDNPSVYGELRRKLPVFLTENPRRDLAVLSARFYGNPERDLKIIGITGTNGKTTTSYLLFGALNSLGERAGIIGTVEWGTADERFPSEMTTPSPTNFFKMLSSLKERGVNWVVCEVSSHALELERVYGIKFKGAVFTNLSRDHLDFHRDMYDYFLSKEKLFFQSEVSLINCDDPFGTCLSGLRAVFPSKVSLYGKRGNYRIERFKSGRFVEISFGEKRYTVRTNLKGEFNAYNVTAAFSLLSELGFPKEELSNSFLNVSVPGRLEEVYPGVFIDYAHTPDALRRVLETLKRETEGRLIVVFGAGGDRDRGKRAPMGRVASELADVVILTADNPRSEPVERIILDILKGIDRKEKVVIEFSRREAINIALSLKKERDTVLIAGKGHENYQIIGNKKFHFSDREVVEEFYGRRRAE